MAPFYLDESVSSMDDSCNDSPAREDLSSQDAKLPSSQGAVHPTFAPSKDTLATLKSRDPFLFYSNDEIRMKTLKCQDTKAAIANAESSRPWERKTRISFELDPLLIMQDVVMDDSLDCAFELEDNYQWDDAKMDLMAELLRI